MPSDRADETAVALSEAATDIGHLLCPVTLSEEEVAKYYEGFSNEIIWPLFHDLPSRCNFDPEYWPVYQAVNRKFANEIGRLTKDEDYVWVQDYQLLLVGAELARLGLRRTSGFFLHIPFPPVDLFLKLPWRNAILDALLSYDLIGFQTSRDRRNFLNCLKTLIAGVSIRGGRQVCSVDVNPRRVRVGVFPIGIDFGDFDVLAASPQVVSQAKKLRSEHGNRKLILGVDRLDYSKGIPERLTAFGRALEQHPELNSETTLLQVVVPSRTGVQQYQWLKRDIERIVGEINGKYSRAGWVPVHYVFRSLGRHELVAHYLAADIALVTPLKDGMNLVAKEYCACRNDGDGVLILSESAGAAAQLHVGAQLVNPYDIQGIADTIDLAVRMEPAERKARMRQLRAVVAKQNVYQWVTSYLKAAFARDLDDFPTVHYYPHVPRHTLDSQTEPGEVSGEIEW